MDMCPLFDFVNTFWENELVWKMNEWINDTQIQDSIWILFTQYQDYINQFTYFVFAGIVFTLVSPRRLFNRHMPSCHFHSDASFHLKK